MLDQAPFRGEIRLWSDGQDARARIQAITRTGPLLFESAVPLSTVRAHVLRALAARGFPLQDAGSQGKTAEAIVGQFGRRLALRRLAQAVPMAFAPGGLAAQLALRQRRDRRRALPGQLAEQVQLPQVAPADEIEGVGYDDVVGLLPAAASSPKVRAGLQLLTAATTNPKALAKVQQITALAKAGSPAAKKAVRVLQLASRLRKRRPSAGKVPAAAAQALQSPRARAIQPGGPPRTTSVAPSPATPLRRFFRDWQRGVQ